MSVTYPNELQPSMLLWHSLCYSRNVEHDRSKTTNFVLVSIALFIYFYHLCRTLSLRYIKLMQKIFCTPVHRRQNGNDVTYIRFYITSWLYKGEMWSHHRGR
jgi:hypothetical protein